MSFFAMAMAIVIPWASFVTSITLRSATLHCTTYDKTCFSVRRDTACRTIVSNKHSCKKTPYLYVTPKRTTNNVATAPPIVAQSDKERDRMSRVR
jgi:hypothetical protein